MKQPGKEETLLAWLQRGIVMIHLDARRPGVAVPPQLAQDPHLRINLSLRYGIPDLVIDDTHVQATLSFGGRPFQCQLPWSAVFGLSSDVTSTSQIWAEDLPREVVETIAAEQAAEEKANGAKRRRPALVAVESVDEEPEAKPESAPTAATTEALRDEKSSANPDAMAAAKEDPAAASSDAQPSQKPPASAPSRGHLRIVR
jgi:stringent starvation protein B